MLSILAFGGLTGCGETSSNQSSSSNAIINSHYDGQGAPLDSFGSDGDTYKDTLTNNEYIKVNGHWLMIGNSNPQTLTGEGAPSDQLGNNGDYYTDTTNGNYYHKQNGKWVLIKEGDNKQTHTVVFDLNGGRMPDGSISLPSQTVANGEWVKKPAQDPVKKNSTFIGWFVDGGDSKWSFTNSVYGDLVLVAKYSVNEDERVILNVNPNNGEETYSIETFAGDTPRIAIPFKEGFNFVGWFFSDTNEQFLGSISAGMNGRTIVARFEKSTFNLTYQVESDNTVTITGLLNIDEVNLVIPSTIDGYTVAAIGEKAFQNRISLSSITLPATIKNIHTHAFRGARMLATIYVDSTNPYFTSVDGVLYSKDMKTLRLCPPKNCTKFSVPSSVKVIGDYAFYGHKDGGVSEISFNEGLREIGVRAFYENYALKTLRFPSSLEVLGDNAFAGATGILDIDLEAGNTNFVINDKILYTSDMKKAVMCPSGRRDAVTIPEGVEEIGNYAFYMVDGCQEYNFPSTLKTIGKQAFAHCYGLREFTIPDTVKSIGENCFDLCENLKTVTIGSGLTEIPSQAFIECYSLSNIDIPSTIKTIGKQAFLGCTEIKSLDLKEGLKEIGNGAFYFSTTEYNENDLPGLTSLNIPNSVEYLGDNAFANQSALTTVSIGSGLTYFGTGAFDGAPVTSLTISNDNQHFTADNKIVYSKDKQELYFALTSLSGEVTLPSGLKVINEYAFEGCKSITAMNFPESLEEIKEGAFISTKITNLEFKSGLKKIGDGAFSMGFVESITFSEGIESIGMSAFSTTDITELTLPSGLKTVGTDAFEGLSSLKDIYYNAANLQTTDLEFEGYENLYIGKSVESIPVRTFSSGKYNVSYDGTKEEWSNVSVDATNAAIYGQYSDSIVICDDTEMFTISLFFEGATLEVNGKVYSDECSFEVPENTKFTGVSDPSGEGLAFAGWYDGPGEDASKLTMPSESSPLRVHSDLTYYARLLEVSASGGLTPDTAIELEDNALQTQTFNLSESVPNIYLKFTPKVSDIYYIRNLSTKTFNDEVYLFSDAACSTQLTYSYNGAGNNKFFLGYELEANKTYYYRLGKWSGDFGDGEIILKFYSRTGDHKEEAIALTANSTVNDEFAPKARLYYSYTPSINEKFSFKPSTIGSLGLNSTLHYVKVVLYNITDNTYDTTYTFSKTKTEYKGSKTTFLTLEAGKQYVFEVYSAKATNYTSAQQNGTDFSFTFTTTAA